MVGGGGWWWVVVVFGGPLRHERPQRQVPEQPAATEAPTGTPTPLTQPRFTQTVLASVAHSSGVCRYLYLYIYRKVFDFINTYVYLYILSLYTFLFCSFPYPIGFVLFFQQESHTPIWRDRRSISRAIVIFVYMSDGSTMRCGTLVAARCHFL